MTFQLLFFTTLFFSSPDVDNSKNYTLFDNNGIFYILDRNELKYLKGENWFKLKHNLNFENYDFYPININSDSYLISSGGGRVLIFKNNTLEIIDNSTFWRSKYHPMIINRNEDIFSFGGYGHFQLRNDFIFFDKNLKEWISYDKESYNENKPYLTQGIIEYDDVKDKLYITLGRSRKSLSNKQVWSFDFKNNIWDEEGVANLSDEVSPENYIIATGSKKPIILNKKNGNIYFFDFKKNELELKQLTKLYDSTDKIHFDFKSGKILLTTQIADKKINTSILDLDQLKYIGSTKIYSKKGTFNFEYLLIFLSLLVFILLLKNRKISINQLIENKERIITNMGDNERKFYTHLTQNFPNYTSFTELGELFQNDLAYETKVKKINDTINRINVCLKKYFLTKDLFFIVSKNAEDSRMKEIRFNTKAKKYKFLKSKS